METDIFFKKPNNVLKDGVFAFFIDDKSNLKNLVALGSSDKSEFNIGYFTKFGDGAADLTPISSLYKLQIREIAKHLGIPENIIAKNFISNCFKIFNHHNYDFNKLTEN